MAKKSAIENNKRRMRLVKQFAARRKRLKDTANNETLSMEERFEARLRLARTAAQFGARAHSQPLRSLWSSRARSPARCGCRVSRFGN